ncbi:MAG: outer membrane lipoprotein-sorting protein [Rhodospirillales bacterium]|nr:outer membrane lipoprotein-sorting protein [Rhodospirillales bacterium]MCB9973906.1 outer membrane lipoprotein-sorting protein [Rhodospirillales bacterium]MCB9980531.1 outer membrane lipoprotein-sorting protein [Rhodospirillales bacterium]
MKLLQITAFTLLALLSVSSARADERGTQLAQSVYDRPDGKTMVSQTTMILEKEGSQTRRREFFSYRQDGAADGEVNLLVRFTVPADVQDTGLLTLSHADGESDQWLYMPALARVRRIAGDRKGGRFVGSDLYYEDMQDRKVNKDAHTYIGQDKVNGAMCDVLESVPVEASSSAYSKKKIWVHPQTLIPIRIDFYEKNQSEPVKRMSVQKVDKVQGIWTVMDVEVKDLKNKHTTRIITDHVVYNSDLPESLFTQAALQDPSREVSYRP